MQREQMGSVVNPMLFQACLWIRLEKAASETTRQQILTNTVLPPSYPTVVYLLFLNMLCTGLINNVLF